MNIIIGAILLCSLAHSVWAQLPEKCALVDCMPPSCPGAYIPRGECCEVCPDCSATFCLMQACAGAFVPPGQCCEVCPSDQCTSNSCQNGGVCYGNPAGGIACACPQGYTGQFCESAAATTCRDIPCQNGGTCRDHFGTYLCECRYGFRGKNCELEPDGRCIHKGEWYNNGQTFFDKCNTCSCSGGLTACTYRGCRSYGCYYLGEWYPVGASYRGDACNNCTCGSGGLFICTDMTCDQCLHKGHLYNDTQTFFDECNTCRCFKGKVACTKKMCRPDGCYQKGQWYPNGGRFLEDACNYCTCIDGRFGCTDMACNQSCSHKGQVYNHGQSFIDECNSCICSNGAVACTLKMCPPGGCVHKGEWYPSGASFKDDCNLCSCSKGAVACDDQACSKTCVVGGVEYQPGEHYRSACNGCQCQQNGLSICTLIACSVGGCDYQGQWYDNGQSFQDDCNTCTCTDGEVSCSSMECTTLHPCATVRCARPDCNNPITPPGACCGVCDQGCDVNGRIYKDGQRVHCKERCGDCFCRGGNVELHRKPCPPPTCLNPITPPGQCCPLCQEHED